MAENPADPSDDRADDADRDPIPRHPDSARELIDALIHRARLWAAWVGPARVIGAAGAALVLAGLGWWLLRSPALPTEAALPVVTHVDADPANTAATSGSAIVSSGSGVSNPTTVATSPTVTTPGPDLVIVHVTGAVNRPGVYQLVAGQRVDDAIAAAGGAVPDADPNALNLAAPVADGDRIEVPVAGADAGIGGGTGGHTNAAGAADGDGAGSDGPLDLNDATADELEALPGIGPATASAIVEFRGQRGPFATVDELLAVPGIGPAKLAAVRDGVTV